MKRFVTIPRRESLFLPEIKNPFVHRLNLEFLDIIKIVVMSFTLAPIRLILAGLFLLAAWPLAAISLAFRSEEEKRKPLSGWRKLLGRMLYFWGKCVTFVFGFYKIRILGKMAPASEVSILCVAPHSSFFDMLVIFAGSTLGTVLAKVELASVPLFGTLVEFTQPVLVRREDPNSRAKTIQEIQRRSHADGEWPQIFIFPEGTCTNRSCLITYKPGAFYPGVPVQPVCLRYSNKPDTITWTWDGPSAFTCLWLTLCQLHNNMEIEFLPVYVPNEQEKKNAKIFANNVRKQMALCLKCPTTDHTYDDCRLMMGAAKLQMPMEAGIVEFQKLHKKLGVSYDQMNRYLERFCKITGNKDMTLKEFAGYLHLPLSRALEEIFTLYDRDHSGTIDFREYVIGLSLISNPANTEETLKLAFQMFQKDNDYICEEDFASILHNAFKMDFDDIHLLFEEVDANKDGKISYDEFIKYASEKPEYAKLFITYQDLVEQNGNLEEANGECSMSKNE